MANTKYDLVIEALEERKSELLAELSGIESSIASFKSKNSNATVVTTNASKKANSDNYDKNWPIARKFGYLLQEHQRFLHFREAAELINKLEGGGYDISELTGKISSGTHSLKKKGLIVKYSVGGKNINSFWGSPNWMDDNTEIKKGHELNTDYVRNSGEGSVDLFKGL